VFSNLYYAKAAFGYGFGWQPTPFVGYWLLAKAKAGKSQTKVTLKDRTYKDQTIFLFNFELKK
jgi:hypothetical protein